MAANDIIGRIKGKKAGLHELDKVLGPEEAARARRSVLEELTSATLDLIGSNVLDYGKIKNRNAENVIGAVQLPLGVVGPLKVNGEYAHGEFYVPFATTEGALIASVSRGAKAITLSGGTVTRVISDSMSRGPVFTVNGIDDAQKLVAWVEKNISGIRSAAESTTAHGKLKSVQPFILGDNVWLRFSFDTGDAMGMNMVTIATEAACEFIEKGFRRATLLALSGNMCSDKKPAQINSILGRGKTVVAEVVVNKGVLKEVYGASSGAIHDINIRKNWLGSARAGSHSYNAHIANTIAAIFIATGQDAAQVVESSSGYTWTEDRGGNLYISVTLPSLEVGTIGGGTSLPTQAEALELMGISGSGSPPGSNARKLAEIMCSAALAGELNLLAALSNRELGRAHSALGRGKGAHRA